MSSLQEKILRQFEKLHASPHKRMIVTIIESGQDKWAQQPTFWWNIYWNDYLIGRIADLKMQTSLRDCSVCSDLKLKRLRSFSLLQIKRRKVVLNLCFFFPLLIFLMFRRNVQIIANRKWRSIMCTLDLACFKFAFIFLKMLNHIEYWFWKKLISRFCFLDWSFPI